MVGKLDGVGVSRNKSMDFLIFIGVVTLMEITLLVEIILIILEVQKIFK